MHRLVRLSAWGFVIIGMVLTLAGCPTGKDTCTSMSGCPQLAATKPATPKPVGQPNPQPADPRPPEPTGNVKSPVTFWCGWEGPRWIEFVPEIPVRNPRPVKERNGRYKNNEYEETIGITPGTTVALECRPMEVEDGKMLCSIKVFNIMIAGNSFRSVNRGKARCNGTVGG